MAGKPKRIEPSDLEFIRTYIGGRILNGTFADMLVNPDQHNKIKKAFEKAASDGDLAGLNKWLDQDVTPAARKSVWGAARSREHRRQNPRAEHTLTKKNALAALEWAGVDDIDQAVSMLLKAAQGKNTKKH